MKRWAILIVVCLSMAGCAGYSGYSEAARPPSSRRYIETFNADGTRRSWGYVEDGQVQLFNVDGSRREVGTVEK